MVPITILHSQLSHAHCKNHSFPSTKCVNICSPGGGEKRRNRTKPKTCPRSITPNFHILVATRQICSHCSHRKMSGKTNELCVCVCAPHREKSIYKLLQIILFFFLWKMLMGGPTGFLSPPNGRGFKRVCFEKHQIWLIVSVNLLLLFGEKSSNERVNAFFFIFLCLGEFSLHT